MNQKNYMPIREFSRLTGIKRENLRFYDQIGLLSPEVRGENNYRYYSRRQLNTAYLVSDLRELGVSLEEIKRYSSQRTPTTMLSLFEAQDKHIRAEMDRLRDMREIMRLRAEMAREALKRGDDALLMEDKAPEPIFLCPPLPRSLSGDEGGIFSYDYAAAHGVNLGYPMGVTISHDDFVLGDTAPVLRYFFKVRRGSNAWKPGGKYAVAYGRCDVWQSDCVYRRLLEFIRAQGLRPHGDAWEEVLLDEMSVQDPTKFCIRVDVRVEPDES